MRIAIFSEAYWPMVSGVSSTLVRTVDALSRRGHVLRVYAPAYPLPRGVPDRPEARRVPGRPVAFAPNVRWGWPNAADVSADLASFGPDLVHVATEASMGWTGARAARRQGVPVVASAHTDYERYAGRYGVAALVGPLWAYLRWFYGLARRVLAPTRAYAARLASRGVPHASVWSRGVDTDRFSPAHRSEAYRAALGLGAGDVLVAYVGRLAPEKGLDRLLAAWADLTARRDDAHLVFTGQGPLQEWVRRRRLPNVHLTGFRRGAELASAYASADVFVMPSVTETFGNVTLEAMASGLACVAFAAGGVLDFGVHGENAWLVPPEDARALGRAIELAVADGDLRRRLGGKARATALSRRWEPVFDALEAEYRAAAGLPAVRPAPLDGGPAAPASAPAAPSDGEGRAPAENGPASGGGGSVRGPRHSRMPPCASPSRPVGAAPAPRSLS